MAIIKTTCFSCDTSSELSTDVGRRDECSKCSADIHVCKNCSLFDEKSYNECKEPQADRVVEKDRSNYCDFFELSSGDGKGSSEKEGLLNAANSLFNKN